MSFGRLHIVEFKAQCATSTLPLTKEKTWGLSYLKLRRSLRLLNLRFRCSMMLLVETSWRSANTENKTRRCILDYPTTSEQTKQPETSPRNWLQRRAVQDWTKLRNCQSETCSANRKNGTAARMLCGWNKSLRPSNVKRAHLQITVIGIEFRFIWYINHKILMKRAA